MSDTGESNNLSKDSELNPSGIPSPQNLQKKISKTLVLQVTSKLLSFVFNIFTARLVSKEIYGYANVTLQFYYTMVLFFMKECLRKSLQKEVDMQKYTSQQRTQSARNCITTCYAINFIVMA